MKYAILILLFLFSSNAFSQVDQFELVENVYRQWRRYTFNKNDVCDKFYFKDSIDSYVIDSVKYAISNKCTFYRIEYLDSKQSRDSIKFDLKETTFILEQFEELNNNKWQENIFENSKKIFPYQIDSMYSVIKDLDIEPIKKLCYNVYTFSRPIYLRNNTICLFYFEERSYVAIEGEFWIFKLQRNKWTKYSPIYITQK